MSRVLSPTDHWQINGHYDNSVDAARPVSLNSGTQKYTFVDGKCCFNFDGSTDLSHAAADTDTIAYTLDGHRYACVAGTTYYKDAASVAPYTFYADATSIGTGLTGKMRDVTHWPVELTADEIAQDFAMSFTPSLLWEAPLPIPQSAPMYSPIFATAYDDGLGFKNRGSLGAANDGTASGTVKKLANGTQRFASSYVDHGNITIGSNSFTIEGWINLTATFSILGNKASAAAGDKGFACILSSGSGAPWFSISDGTNQTRAVIPGGVTLWNKGTIHVAWVIDRTAKTCTAYLNSAANGTPLALHESLGSIDAGSVALRVGMAEAGTLTGDLSGMNIHLSALTPAQIKQIYRAGVHADRDGELLNLTDGYRDLSTYNRTLTISNVVRYPDEWMEFDGNSGSISMADISDLTGDITVEGEMYLDSLDGRIFDNGKLLVYVSSISSRMAVQSNGVTTAVSATSSIATSRVFHFVITRTSSGVTNFYINGVLSGTADQSSGTPAAGTTNLFVGNRSADDRTFDGKLRVRILKGIKTAAWAKKRYIDTRVLP